mgnify:CR=1 FL=1
MRVNFPTPKRGTGSDPSWINSMIWVWPLIVPGNPIPLARHRFSRSGGQYLPQKSQAYRDWLHLHFVRLVNRRSPYEGMVQCYLKFYRDSKSNSDLDNLVKAIFDAANNILWKDDGQVVFFQASKYYDKKHPRLELTILPYAL